MRKLNVVTAVSLILIFMFSVLCYGQKTIEITDGEELVRKVWEAMRTTDLIFIENILAPGFQSIHQDGSRNRADQIELIRGLKMGKYVLDNFKITENKNTLNVSYFVNVKETIDDNVINKRSARLSVFTKTADGWKWFSHANLVPLK